MYVHASGPVMLAPDRILYHLNSYHSTAENVYLETAN